MKSARRLLLLSGASRAALSLDFTTGSLDSRITFSRPSLATMYDSTGKLTFCPNNLLTYSATPSNAAWFKISSTVSGNIVSFTGAPGAFQHIGQSISPAPTAGDTFIWAAQLSGSGTLSLDGNAFSGSVLCTLSATPTWFFVKVTNTSGSPQVRIMSNPGNTATGVTVHDALCARVTYETSIRSQDQVTTTSAAYYGPRFDYNPSTLAARGLLIEEARTNICTYSEQFDNAAWFLTNATVTANATTAPNGLATADALFETAATGYHSITVASTIIATVSGSSYTFSTYIKANGRTKGYLSVVQGGGYVIFDLTAKTNVFGGNGTNETVVAQSIQELLDGWFRLSITSSFTGAANVRPVIGINNDSNASSYTGDVTKGFYVFGADVEQGAFATSYIPTGSSSVARSADSVSITGLSFPNAAFTLLHSFEVGQSSGSFQLGDFYYSTTPENNRLNWYGDNTVLNFFYKSGGASQFSDSFSTVAANTRYKFGLAVTTNDAAKSRNGSAAASVGTTFAMGSSINSLKLGGNYAGVAGQTWHASLAIYASRLPNTRLQALTT